MMNILNIKHPYVKGILISLPFCLLISGSSPAARMDELKKDHTRFIMFPNAAEKIGKFSVKIKVENEEDLEKAKKLRRIVTEAVDESFQRLLLEDHLAPDKHADSHLLIRVVEAEKKFKFAGLRCISYGYLRLFVDLIDNKTEATILTGVSEGFESKSDTFLFDHWLRKRLFKDVCEQAVEKIAVRLKSMTQGQTTIIDFDKPAFIEKRMAILPFGETSPESKDDGLGKLVSNIVTTAIGQIRTFIVLERLQVERAVEELNFGQSGYVEAGSAKRLGKLLAADYLLVGNVGSKGSAVEIDARVVDTETGEVIASAGESVGKISTLRSAVNRLALNLSNQYLKGQGRRW
jgi:TolB-like protein